MADVFISYSRRDKAFVRALCHALQERSHKLWIDWDGIRVAQGMDWCHDYLQTNPTGQSYKLLAAETI